jgi:hypothetical protein
MRTSALSARLSEVLLWLVWPVLALALACISGTALTGPKPVSGQFLPSWSHAEAPVAQNSLLHREIWPSTIPPPSAPTLSGLYAGNGGLNVNVAGNTTLTAGTLSSTAAADLNSFTTGTLTVNSEQNHSDATATSEGFSFSGGANLGSVASGGAGGVAAIGQSLLGNGLAAGTGGLSGGGVDQTSRSTSSSVITASITPVITSGQAVQGTYDTSSAGANPTLTNSFDAQTLTNDLAIQQIAGQLTAEGLGDVADALANSSNPTLAKAFSEGGLGRILLETAGNAGVAALGGGNVAAAAGGTLAGGLATNLAAAADLFPNDPVLAALATNILESGAGALGGVIGGAATGGNTGIDALTGAGSASLIQLYNQGNDGVHSPYKQDSNADNPVADVLAALNDPGFWASLGPAGDAIGFAIDATFGVGATTGEAAAGDTTITSTGEPTENIQFGSNQNQNDHTFRHVVNGGYDATAVQNAITSDLNNIGSSLSQGQYTGTVTVNGTSFNYSAYKLPDGTINVGRITPPR